MNNNNEQGTLPGIPSLDESREENRELSFRNNAIDGVTAQECINDIQQLANRRQFEDPLAGPISRDYYRAHGAYRDGIWAAHFGNFTEFLRQANLKETRHTTKLRNQAAKHVAMDAVRKVNEERKHLGKTYERNKSKSSLKTMIACSDLHDKECDPFFLRVLIETIKDVEPDVICLNGDIFDAPEFGKYNVEPRDWDAVGRLKAGLNIIRQIREAAPDTQIDFIEGNHEARVVKHFLEYAPATMEILSGLHGFDICKFFKLDEYNVNYIANSDLMTFTDAQTRKESIKNYKIYWNCLLAHHFPKGREFGS